MSCNYIIRLKNNKLAAFYSKNPASVIYRVYENNRWQEEIRLIENVRDKFSINFDNTGGLRIFCQDMEGSVLSVRFDNGPSAVKIILKNPSENVNTILFHSLTDGNSLSILYNIPIQDKRHKLVRQNLEENGSWGRPFEIDVFNPFGSNLFEVQHISYEHALAFYRKEGNINNIGYREITPTRLGEFNAVQRQGENILSHSFLTDTEAVYILYITAGMFSSRLIYRKKENEAFDEPVILWESHSLENCLLIKISGKINAFFQSNGNMYVIKSMDNGQAFSKPELYKEKICKNPIKAHYLSFENMGNLNHTCRDVFVDSFKPWDIQILPEICDNFYPYTKVDEQIILSNEADEQISMNESKYKTMVDDLTRLTEESQNYKEEITRLKQTANDIELKAVGKISEKDDIIRNYSEKNQSLTEEIERLKALLADFEKKVY